MSFIVKTKHADYADDQVEFEQMQNLLAHLSERIAQWNNFEVEIGLDWLEISIHKPVPDNALGVSVTDAAQTADHLR